MLLLLLFWGLLPHSILLLFSLLSITLTSRGRASYFTDRAGKRPKALKWKVKLFGTSLVQPSTVFGEGIA
jgi:hypothetical protein